MKKSLLVLALACIPSLAFAQTGVGVGVGQSSSTSASGAAAVSGSAITINNPANTTARVESAGTTTVRTVPSMVAPGLTAAGLETCLGSASGGVSAVGFGVTGGSTYKDEDCTARLDSRTLFAMGLKGAAVARLCQRPDIWRSMPDVCEKYWPAGVPLPAGIVVTRPTVLSASVTFGSMRVIDGRDGIEKDCLNYRAEIQKCMQWAGEPVRRPRPKVAHIAPTKSLEQAKKTKPALPAAITNPPAEAPKAEEKKS